MSLDRPENASQRKVHRLVREFEKLHDTARVQSAVFVRESRGRYTLNSGDAFSICLIQLMPGQIQEKCCCSIRRISEIEPTRIIVAVEFYSFAKPGRI